MAKKKITSKDLKVSLEKIGQSTDKTPASRTGGATLDHCKTRIPCNTDATCDTCETCYACGPTLNPSLNAGTICSSEGNCTSNNCNQTEQTDCVATISAGAVCCEYTKAQGCQQSVDTCLTIEHCASKDICLETQQQATCEAKTCQPVESLPNCDSSLITCFCGGPSVSYCPTPNPNDDK